MPPNPTSLLLVPHISQLGSGTNQHINDCGAACGAMILQEYNGMLHFLFTMGFLILYPPVNQLTFAIVPITWCAALCLTVTIYPFMFPVRRRVMER